MQYHNYQHIVNECKRKITSNQEYKLNTDEISTINNILSDLNDGKINIVTYRDNKWLVNTWIQEAILLYFRITQSYHMIQNGIIAYDKIPLKFNAENMNQLPENNIRVVPGATVRYGSNIGKNAIIMPSFINIGAHVGSGTMIDTWATVGSCAYIGNNCHISGGVGIGGVLEPPGSTPAIIEDNCFIGARSEITAGVLVQSGSVIATGTYITPSTKIYNRQTKQTTYGTIPQNSVVIPGGMVSECNGHTTYCVVIVKQVDEKTRRSTNINEILRA